MNTETLDRPLISNGFTLPPQMLGKLQPTDPSLPMNDLREQYRAQGYLWLKQVLDRNEVLAFRHRFFAAFEEAGLLAPGSDAVDGIYSGYEDKETARKILMEAVRWASYESFCFAPPIWQFYEAFLGGPVYLHKRKIVRYTRPYDPNCTGAHYDLTYLRGGTDSVCTSWIPIGDIPVEMGGLVYLEGSDRWGRETEEEFRRKNAELSPEERISAYNKNMTQGGWLSKDLPNLAARMGTRWLVADYEAGDMMVHSAYMIHAATLNESSENRLRLSTDIRYQLVREEIDQRWQNHWSLDDML
ncbi:MAG: phytanoyl-CoA dioxygenase family protein [Caldilineaceae bacterium]|nr:phytanoyl-CoA dioxygenase family protein [Caldilineaceae bacterium]